MRILTIIVLFLSCQYLVAQSVHWATRPTYRQIQAYGDWAYKYYQDGKVGLLDLSGKVVVDAAYDSITDIVDNYGAVLALNGGNYQVKGILHYQSGAYSFTTISEVFYASKHFCYFSEGKMPVRNNDGAYGYIDISGRLIIPFVYGEARPFFEGRASVKKNNDKQHVYYINESGKALQVEPGNGEILFGTSFSNGEAVVFTLGRKGYVINKSGRAVRGYKGEVNAVLKSLNRSDYTIPGREHTSLFNPQLSKPVADNVTPFKEGPCYGYEKGALRIVPAQFDEACSFKAGYAVVKIGSKYGFLALSNGSFDASLNKTAFEVHGNKKCDPVTCLVNIPADIDASKLQLKVFGPANEYKTAASVVDSRQVSYTFVPQLEKKEKEQELKFELYTEDILVWTDSKQITFSYPVMIKVGEPVAPNERADQHDKFALQVYVENSSGDALDNLVVVFHVDGLGNYSNSISLHAGESKKATVNIPNITTESQRSVYVTLSNGISSRTAKINFKPFY